MKRVLIIPAAGRGSRLGSAGPKALHPVAGRPMIDWIVERHRPYVDFIVLVASPDAERAMKAHLQSLAIPGAVAVQAAPTGMLPAILCATDAIRTQTAEQIWITWCDQVTLSDTTARRLADTLDLPDGSFAFPLVRQAPPYIHFVRDAQDRIVDVLQRREGAAMPEVGDSDTGLFGMRRDVFVEDLPSFARLAQSGAGTGEQNFLPFIPWLAARKRVLTFPIVDAREARGVNTPEDLAAAESLLQRRR